jgi:hypothetical protein
MNCLCTKREFSRVAPCLPDCSDITKRGPALGQGDEFLYRVPYGAVNSYGSDPAALRGFPCPGIKPENRIDCRQPGLPRRMFMMFQSQGVTIWLQESRNSAGHLQGRRGALRYAV